MLKFEDNINQNGKQHRCLVQLHKKYNGLSETLFGFVKTNLRKMFHPESVIHLMVNHGEVDSLMAYSSD